MLLKWHFNPLVLLLLLVDISMISMGDWKAVGISINIMYEGWNPENHLNFIVFLFDQEKGVISRRWYKESYDINEDWIEFATTINQFIAIVMCYGCVWKLGGYTQFLGIRRGNIMIN